jgi:hypothetical protein
MPTNLIATLYSHQLLTKNSKSNIKYLAGVLKQLSIQILGAKYHLLYGIRLYWEFIFHSLWLFLRLSSMSTQYFAWPIITQLLPLQLPFYFA